MPAALEAPLIQEPAQGGGASRLRRGHGQTRGGHVVGGRCAATVAAAEAFHKCARNIARVFLGLAQLQPPL